MPRRKTNEEYIEECKQYGYDLPIEEYKGSSMKIKHKCNKCGNVYLQSPHKHLIGHGCPKCAREKQRLSITLTNSMYIKKCKDSNLDMPLDEYKGNKEYLSFRCSICNLVYKQQAYAHLNGRRCPYCFGTKRKTTQEYINECKQLGYDLPIEGYKSNKLKIKHKCKLCGSVYKQKPNAHLSGNGCPICNESHGERYIRNYLDNHNIVYESQKKFNGLKDKQPLSYDFYLSKQKVLIEYQGIQHFESVSFDSKASSDLETQQYHDKLKREYAQKYGYTLLEPTYKLDNQEKINKYLDNHI